MFWQRTTNSRPWGRRFRRFPRTVYRKLESCLVIPYRRVALQLRPRRIFGNRYISSYRPNDRTYELHTILITRTRTRTTKCRMGGSAQKRLPGAWAGTGAPPSPRKQRAGKKIQKAPRYHNPLQKQKAKSKAKAPSLSFFPDAPRRPRGLTAHTVGLETRARGGGRWERVVV